MYNLPYAYAYALSDMRRITLVLMHILIQPPSSYKTSDGAETHDSSTHAINSLAVILIETLMSALHSVDDHGVGYRMDYVL
jgi:hypothetical protein